MCDFGTATTLDAVTAKGEYLGGAICPGVTISADALFQRAARLPRIDVRKPSRAIGRTTVGAMESGLFYGYVGMVEGLMRRMSDELGGHAMGVATGGLAAIIAPETPLIEHVDIDLTLQGLRIVWEQKPVERDCRFQIFRLNFGTHRISACRLHSTAARSKPTSVRRTTGT